MNKMGDTFKCIFLSENIRVMIQISVKFASEGPRLT